MNEFSFNDSLEEVLKTKRVYLFGDVELNSAKRIIREMLAIENQFIEEGVPQEERALTFVINSNGGSVSAGLAIYDVMRYIKCQVKTVCLGVVASMGAFLLACGTKGKRYAFENSEIMIHQPLGSAAGQAKDIKIIAEHITNTKLRLNKILSQNTGKDLDTIESDCDRDFWMSAKEALDYGLIDHVVNSNDKEIL